MENKKIKIGSKVKVTYGKFVLNNITNLFEKYNFINKAYNDYDENLDYVFEIIGFEKSSCDMFSYLILDNKFKDRYQLVCDERGVVLMEMNNNNKF